jgi:thiosulfate dehydrogenase [quinone] large subunit
MYSTMGSTRLPPPPPECAAEQEERISSRVSAGALWILVVPLRIFLAVGWLRAAAEKLIDAAWWDGNGVKSFLVTERPLALPFLRPLMDGVLQDRAVPIAVVVVIAEVGCSLAIATGRGMRVGLWIAVALNVAFVLCGRVNPSAFYVVMEIVLLFALAEGAIGPVARRDSGRRGALVASVVASCCGMAMLPFIRTLAPADVIADPAAMLAFLGVVVGFANAARWAAYQPAGTAAHGAAMRLVEWAHARPPAVRPAITRAALPSHINRPLRRAERDRAATLVEGGTPAMQMAGERAQT